MLLLPQLLTLYLVWPWPPSASIAIAAATGYVALMILTS
jgi:hypothetical protein